METACAIIKCNFQQEKCKYMKKKVQKWIKSPRNSKKCKNAK